MTIVMNAPDRVGKYRITGIIGRGDSGVVYKAIDAGSQRVVALKSLEHFASEGARAVQAFTMRMREQAQALARLAHPGIVAIHEIDEADGRPFIAMEHVQGLNLGQWLEATPLPPQSVILQVMNQLLDALDGAHAAGMRHGDIKLSNLIVTSTGVVKVSDFGLARAERRTGAAAGIAPEYQSGRIVDHRVDIYAAGLILYRMLVGQDPFVSSMAFNESASLGATARPPSMVAEAGRSAVFDAVVARAMAHEAGQRFASAAEFRDALAAATDLRVPTHGAGSVTLGAAPRAASDLGLNLQIPSLDGLPTRVSTTRPAPSGEAAAALPVLTIAIPDSVLAMPSFDPWAVRSPDGNTPKDRGESQLAADTLPNDEAYASFLDQVDRDRRNSVAAAAAAANEAMNAADARAGARLARLPLLPTPTPTSGLIITGPVYTPSGTPDRLPGEGGPERLANDDLQLPNPAESDNIPAEALRRVLRVLSSHFGSNAGDILKHVAGRASTIAELHTLLLEQAGETIDKKKMAKQLKAVAKLPL